MLLHSLVLCLTLAFGVMTTLAQLPQIQVVVSTDNKLSFVLPRTEGEVVLVRSVDFEATFTDGSLAFRTERVTSATEDNGTQTFRFNLSGEVGKSAEVKATVRPAARGVIMRWTIRYQGEALGFSPWATGFRLDFAAPIENAMTKSTIRWVKPTGKEDWEVPGDMPYPDLECQVRQVGIRHSFPLKIAFVTHWYDPDWIYGNNVERARFMQAGLPKESPAETTFTFAVLNAEGVEPEDLAAISLEYLLSLKLSTGRRGNLFKPAEPITLAARIANVAGSERKGSVSWYVRDYYGALVADGKEEFSLRPQEIRNLPLRIVYKKRGILFAVVRLREGDWEREQWLTLGILPERPLTQPDPLSPFGLAAIIANPDVYPDQPDLETVLALAQRIGVRWVRYCPFPVKSEFTSEEEKRVREQVRLFHHYGILLNPQIGIGITEREKWQEELRSTLKMFHWVSDYIELGNELNPLGVSAEEQRRSAQDYVERILKPFHTIMRQVHPKGKVMNHGLAGVWGPYLEGLEEAGGFALIDVLSVHPGFHPRAPEFYEGWEGWVFRTQMEKAMDVARRHSKEVWITEVYAPTPPSRSAVDLRTSADYLVRTYILSLLMGVRVVEWYQLQDGTWFSQIPNPRDIEYNFGIIYSDLSPKPAYIAYGVMTEQLEGARCVGRLDLGADDLYDVRFEKDGRWVDVLWSYRERHEVDLAWWPPEEFKDKSRLPGMPWENRWHRAVAVKLSATSPVIVTDIMGNSRTLKPHNGFVTLQLSGSPLFVCSEKM